MAGPTPSDRVPKEQPRLRRLQSDQNQFLDFTDPGSVIEVDEDGFLQLKLRADGGLENDNGELAILLDPAGEDLLELSVAGLNVDEDELYSFVNYYG